MQEFKKELESLINKHSIENICDVPDFLLADIVCNVLLACGPLIKQLLDWHVCDSACHPAQEHLVQADAKTEPEKCDYAAMGSLNCTCSYCLSNRTA